MRIWKQPSEKRTYSYDFTDLLAGQTITSILSADSAARGGGAGLTKEGESFSPSIAQITWGGGTSNVTYRTTVRVRDSANREHELDGEIFVSETEFVLPPGIGAGAYLTGEEYVERFGFEETIRLTDEDRRGAIDAAALAAALADAQQLADGYLATRYTLPLANPPELVRALVADLARERLHKSRPTPAVTEAADRARTLLRDLSAGRAALLIESVEVSAGATGFASWAPSADALIFNAEKLARF